MSLISLVNRPSEAYGKLDGLLGVHLHRKRLGTWVQDAISTMKISGGRKRYKFSKRSSRNAKKGQQAGFWATFPSGQVAACAKEARDVKTIAAMMCIAL